MITTTMLKKVIVEKLLQHHVREKRQEYKWDYSVRLHNITHFLQKIEKKQFRRKNGLFICSLVH